MPIKKILIIYFNWQNDSNDSKLILRKFILQIMVLNTIVFGSRWIFHAPAVARPYVMRWAIWHHLYNLKNVKNIHGGVLLLVKLQAY